MESFTWDILNTIVNSWLYYLALEALPLYLLGQLVCCIGLYALFSKITEKRRLAFVPGTNCARLGELFDIRIAGFLMGMSQILILPVVVYIDYFFSYGAFDIDTATVTALVFSFVVLILFRMVTGFFVFGRMIVVMNESRWWLIAFTILPNLTLLCWGLNPRIRE